jgi:hypothetical protein
MILIFHDMTHSLIYLDRYRNEGTRIYSPHAAYSEAWEAYRPNSALSAFTLPTFLLPAAELDVFSANPHPELIQRYLPGEEAVFCVHPQLLQGPSEDPYLLRTISRGVPGPSLQVSPSSSTRTLYVRDAHPLHALKVHFPFRVSRYGRRMRAEVVEQALNVSKILEAGINRLDSRFAFFREVLGVTHPNLHAHACRGENWGYLVRDMTPFPTTTDQRDLVPGFALYGGDFFNPEAPPLIVELMGDRDPEHFLLGDIVLPIIQHWVTCFLEFGLILEPHGQNILFEVGEGNDIRRIVHRDLNLGIDMRRRRERDLPEEDLNDYNRMEGGEFNSIAYDKFMGSHFFEQLLSTVQRFHPRLDIPAIREASRVEFAGLFPEHERYLPGSVQYFSEDRDRFGKPLFLDTGETPRWRP